jgi:hypothetical protein
MFSRIDPSADQLLVAGCQAGDPTAWRQLLVSFRKCVPFAISEALGPDAVNRNLADQLEAELLSSLYLRKKLLNSYDPAVASLKTYLAFLARQTVKFYLLTRHRRKNHEVSLAEAKLPEPISQDLPPDILEEFERRLTRAERDYYRRYFSPDADAAERCPYPDAYRRQLKHRILKKLLANLYDWRA